MEKKKFIFFILIIFEISIPILTAAITPWAITPGSIPDAQQLRIQQDSPIKSSDALLNVIANIVKWVYTIFFIVAVMFILFAAFNYLGGAGSPERLKKAHSMIIYAAIAIAIALLSVGVVTIIQNFLQPSTGTEKSSEPQPNHQKPFNPYEQLAPPWNPPIEQPGPGGTISS